MRRRFTADQWTRWFDEFDASGLSVKAFCKRLHVSENAFYQWRRKLNRCPGEASSGVFVPVAVATENEVKIEMPCGATIHVSNDPESLRPVFQTLLQLQAVSR